MPKNQAARDAEASREAAEHERFLQANARLNAVFREVRDRPVADDSDDHGEELAGEVDAWEEALDGVAAETGTIPDLGDSISRIRARLRERIKTGTNPYPTL
jgi:hypothetical protein